MKKHGVWLYFLWSFCYQRNWKVDTMMDSIRYMICLQLSHVDFYFFFFYKEMIIIIITATPVKPASAFHQWNFASMGETSYRNYCFICSSLLKKLCFFLAISVCTMEALTNWQRAPCCSGIPLYDVYWFTSSINWWVWWQINLWWSVVVGPRRYQFALKYFIYWVI